MAEQGSIGRTFSRHVRGLAAPGVNLFSNMVKERCEQLTTWPLRKEHSVLQQLNLAKSLAQTNLFRHKREERLLRSKAKTRRCEKQRCFKKMQVQNRVTKAQTMATHKRK
jgi:hypothetical protein